MFRVRRHFLTAFTLIEVLVVISIIGAVIAIMLPAIQAARESSRRASCANNIRQLAIAAKLHTDSHSFYPTGGWGADWVGDPDRGFGPQQPGGWIYNILPYLEQKNLRELGSGSNEEAKRAAIAQLLSMSLPELNCPTRRSATLYTYNGPKHLKNVDPPEQVAKSDYVINRFLSYEKSEIPISEVQLAKGQSKTVLVGEKSIPIAHITDGLASGDKLSMYVGDCADISRDVLGTPVPDHEERNGFGSQHPSGCNIAMCDGSIRFVGLDDEIQP